MRGSCSYRKNGMFAKIGCAREARCGCNDIRRHRLAAFPKVVEFGDGEIWKFDYSNMGRNGVGYPMYSAFNEEWGRFAGLFNERDNVVYWKTKRKINDDLQYGFSMSDSPQILCRIQQHRRQLCS